jgi:hypothetical protein
VPEPTTNEPAAAPTGPTPNASGTSGASPSSSPTAAPDQAPTTAPPSSPSSSPTSPTTDQPSGDPAKAEPAAPKPGEPPAPPPGEAPPKDGAKPADPAPSPTAAYDALALPPQIDPASPALGEFKELAARHKVAPEAAQELVQFYADQLEATVAAQNAARAAQDAAWAKEVRQDPEIGHLNWPHTSRAIAKLREALPTVNAAIGALEQHGLGNNPALVRAFRDLGFAYVEDKLVVAGSSAGKANPYPNTPGMRE